MKHLASAALICAVLTSPLMGYKVHFHNNTNTSVTIYHWQSSHERSHDLENGQTLTLELSNPSEPWLPNRFLVHRTRNISVHIPGNNPQDQEIRERVNLSLRADKEMAIAITLSSPSVYEDRVVSNLCKPGIALYPREALVASTNFPACFGEVEYTLETHIEPGKPLGMLLNRVYRIHNLRQMPVTYVTYTRVENPFELPILIPDGE